MSGKNRVLSRYSNRWNIIDGDFTVPRSGDYAVDTSVDPVSILLPDDMGVGSWVRIIDLENNTSVNPIVVNGGTLNIVGRRSDAGNPTQYFINTDGQHTMFVFDGFDWIAFPGIDVSEQEITEIADNSAISFAIALG